jgi:hypothetical protein
LQGAVATPAAAKTPKNWSKVSKPEPTFENVVSFLASRPAANRPRKRTGLVRVIETHFKGRITPGEAEALVKRVVETGTVSEADGKLTFHC